MKNQIAPKKFPHGMCANTTGSVLKAQIERRTGRGHLGGHRQFPRNTTAAGIVISPPKTTSKNSLVADAVRPDSTTSSRLRTYEA